MCGLGCKLIVTKPDADRATSELEPVHLLESFLGLRRIDELNEAIALRAAGLFFLQLHEFELTKRLKNILQVIFGDGEVDVADVKAVEWYAVRLGSGTLGVARLAVLLCFSELCNNRNAQ